MMVYAEMSKEQLLTEKGVLEQQYAEYKAKGLKLDMSRGKPAPEQLDLSIDMLLHCLDGDYKASNGIDCRNYGILDGIPEAKKLFEEMLDIGDDEIIVGGNSSLQLMYDTIIRALHFGVYGGDKPWGKCEKVKFLCPVPGYDRHFAICESLGIEMIPVQYKEDGPDMDEVERLVSSDEEIKGIWCVPMYSNPTGITYSDEVVRRFAALKPAAKDFRIFWDNAYCVHHLSDDHDSLLNIIEECKKAGNPDMVFQFTSTSKISFPGGGLAVIVASKNNIDFIKNQMTVQTIGFDKLNQLRHCKFFKNYDGIKAHMKKHAAIIQPKFSVVLYVLNKEIAPLGIGKWVSPKGGYFVSFDAMEGCAKRIVSLAAEAGVVMTGAGATYPYGKDPKDSNIRIAPTFPSVDELRQAMEIFCVCVKLASVEKLLAE
ncbi:MAG: aminotransferase class I/II-fold pyridoxal phosphate-dependent enzyme [Oscillospiraceae bacterium]|nr:aminotransferase class I/II-fold pyridoxal phosphate-dependent enzyme [Oscillospiraceae bacterium]